MCDEDFEREIKAALGDIVDSAPKPPKWKWITGGRAPLTSDQPASWYRRSGAAFLGAAAVALLVVGVAAMIGSGPSGDDSGPLSTAPVEQTAENLLGLWVLESYTSVDAAFTAPVTSDGYSAPWIEFTTDNVDGFSGCNTFGANQAAGISSGRLVLGEVVMTAAGCADPNPEVLIVSMIWSGPEGVEIEITATTFQVETPLAILVFVRADRQPVRTLSEWSVGSDDLACSDDVVLDHRLIDPTATVTEMLLAVPGVVELEELAEFEYSPGFDSEGSVVANVIAGDIEPRQYHRRSCASLWGIRSGADLGGAVATWVNDLGLAQRATDIWSNRFVEMCSAPTSELDVLAPRYVSEDASSSLMAGGALPSSDQATATLGTIWRMACAASSFEDSHRAARFSVVGPVDPASTVVPLLVQGGACVEADGDHITTEIVDIKVHEEEDVVLITPWTREVAPPSAKDEGNYICAGIGVELDAVAILAEPLGSRVLLDGGQSPPGTVEIISPRLVASETCSTTGMDGVEFEDYAPSWEGLPDAVAETRNRLLNAAMECDIEQIVAIAQEGGAGDGEDSIFWGATASLDELIERDANDSALRSLVLALTTLPWQAIGAETYDAANEEIVPHTYFTWPPVTEEFEGGSGLSDQWSVELLERVAAMNGQTVAQVLARADEVSAYWGFRTGINEDGVWLFALDGD